MFENIYPKDWKIKEMNEIFGFSGGYTAARKDLGHTGIAYLHYGDIHTSRSTILDVDKDINIIPKINLKKQKLNHKFLLKNSDIVFVDASEDYAGVSKFIVINNEKSIPIISGLHTITARDKKNILDIEFKRYVFQEYNVKKQFMFYAAGQKVKGINKENIKKIIIPIPDIKEQKKIAKILSVWDRAINLRENELKNVLTYKENITKQLVSRYLKKQKNNKEERLSEFLKSKTIRVGNKKIEPVAVGVLGIRKRSEIFDKQLSTNLSNNKIIEQNDLCFGIGTNKIVYDVLFEDAQYCVSPAYRVYEVINCNPYYLKSYLDTYNSYFSKKYMIVSARQGKSIEIKGLMNEKIKMPSIDIQNKIVKYLESIDNYINVLQLHLSQIKIQKKGLMQQLLTGKIRVKV